MNLNEELRRRGEAPATPDEEADAGRLDAELERRRRGEPAPPEEDETGLWRTADWLDDHAAHSASRADAWELDELRRLFPRFEPVRCLGRGGMGVVYLARRVTFDH